MILWFIVTTQLVYYGMLLILNLFLLSYGWFFLGSLFFLGLSFFLFISLPALINIEMIKFYRSSWLSVIAHSSAGLLGIIFSFYSIYFNPPEIVIVDGSPPQDLHLSALWEHSWLRTIMLGFSFIGLQLGVINSTVIIPIRMKLDKNQD